MVNFIVAMRKLLATQHRSKKIAGTDLLHVEPNGFTRQLVLKIITEFGGAGVIETLMIGLSLQLSAVLLDGIPQIIDDFLHAFLLCAGGEGRNVVMGDNDLGNLFDHLVSNFLLHGPGRGRHEQG